MKKIAVDVSFEQTRLALLEDGSLAELVIENENGEANPGDIYCCEVKNVLAGMQAVFVDIGEKKNAYLPIGAGEKIKTGSQFAVQVEKAATGTKGAVVTRKLSFSGKYMVLLPTEPGQIGVSRKIGDLEERKRLQETAASLLPENFGLILRTECEGKRDEVIREELLALICRAEAVLKKGTYTKAPALLYRGSDGAITALREWMKEDVSVFYVNERTLYEELLERGAAWGTEAEKFCYYQEETPLFTALGIETQVQKALEKHVWLKSGGYLVIEQTEACVVIDVNTGKFTGKKEQQKTFLKTNLEAAVEIAHQLRLRNLSGIIIVDFIDLRQEEDKKQVEETLKRAVSRDRIPVSVVGMTSLGLMQLTRKKTRPSLHLEMTGTCKCCNGTGRVPSLSVLVASMRRQVSGILQNACFSAVTVRADERLLYAFAGTDRNFIADMNKKYGGVIYLVAEKEMLYGEYKIEKKKPDAACEKDRHRELPAGDKC